MRLIVIAALLCAVAPLCAQSSLNVNVNAQFTGQNQSRALLLEMNVGATPAAATIDVQVSTTHPDGIAVVLYSPNEEYTYSPFGPQYYFSQIYAVTGVSGQGSFSHTLPAGGGTQRFALECFPAAPSQSLDCNCMLSIQTSAGVLSLGAERNSARQEGYLELGLGARFISALSTVQTTSEHTLISSTASESVCLMLEGTNASVDIYDVTGATPVSMGSYSFSGTSAGGGSALRQLPHGTRKIRFVCIANGGGASIAIEVRPTAGAVLELPPAPTPAPNPGTGGTAFTGGSGGGGGCVAGSGAGLPLVAALLLVLRRRRKA